MRGKVASAVLMLVVLSAGCLDSADSLPDSLGNDSKPDEPTSLEFDDPKLAVANFWCTTRNVTAPWLVEVRLGAGSYPSSPYGHVLHYRRTNEDNPVNTTGWTFTFEDDASIGSVGVTVTHDGTHFSRTFGGNGPPVIETSADSFSIRLCDDAGPAPLREEVVILRTSIGGERSFQVNISGGSGDLKTWSGDEAAVTIWSVENLTKGTSVSIDGPAGGARAMTDAEIELDVATAPVACREFAWFNPKAHVGLADNNLSPGDLIRAWVEAPDESRVPIAAGQHFAEFLRAPGTWKFVVEKSMEGTFGNSPILMTTCLP